MSETLPKPDFLKELDGDAETTRVVGFMRGRGGGPPPKDWLTPMAMGTQFLGREKGSSGYLLNKYTVIDEGDISVHLTIVTPSNEEIQCWVHPVYFCNHVELVEILNKEEEKDG